MNQFATMSPIRTLRNTNCTAQQRAHQTDRQSRLAEILGMLDQDLAKVVWMRKNVKLHGTHAKPKGVAESLLEFDRVLQKVAPHRSHVPKAKDSAWNFW